MTAEPAIRKPPHPLPQLTTYELRDYRRELEQAISRGLAGPTLVDLRRRLDEVLAEQDYRAREYDAIAARAKGMPMRDHDVTMLTAAELDRARRELHASLALARPGSPLREPARARLRAIDAELGRRDQAETAVTDQAETPAAATARQAAFRCACGFAAGDVTALEDHLFTFPDDDHYELAPPQPR
ncbi:MAG TPA: hypothetical protein VKV80_05700 [Streptosporangiaceae bacterium]|jgi:hypothetical protein|nr:hypothetical protein [Streptosporangiaceae bacterium]